MSTRCTLTVHDGDESFSLYRHSDGYPDTQHGVLNTLRQAFDKAWPLPRFEASDFCAAIIAAWKQGGGNIRMTDGPDSHGDTEFHYDITSDGRTSAILVQVRRPHDVKAVIGAYAITREAVTPVKVPKPRKGKAARQQALAEGAGFRLVLR